MTFGLAIRITLALVVILAAGVAVTIVLSAHMFERTLSDFPTSRFEFELNDVRQRIEIRMDLGIALAELQSVSEELQEYLHADEQKARVVGRAAGPFRSRFRALKYRRSRHAPSSFGPISGQESSLTGQSFDFGMVLGRARR